MPRSFVNEGVNELLLFEEFGGNPTLVNVQRVGVGSVCGSAYEEKHIEISCNGRNISSVKFASFGNPQGTCGLFIKGTCESKNDAISLVQKVCILSRIFYLISNLGIVKRRSQVFGLIICKLSPK